MDQARSRDAGRLAIAVGAVAAGSVVSLATFFAAGGPFGTINDFGNAAVGVLSGALAWQLRRHVEGRAGGLAVGAALVGAVITVAGSALVISGTTGFFFAGLISSVGFAGIGAWLLALNRSRGVGTWPTGLRRVGVIAGALMALGIATAPGIPLRFDDMATAPAWLWIGFVGWLGIYVVYPMWAIWMGAYELRQSGRSSAVAAGLPVAH